MKNNKIYTIEQIKNLSIPVFKKYPTIKKVYLFGSYARGEADETSDLDFMIELKDDSLETYRKSIIIDVDLEDVFEKQVDIIEERDMKFLRSKKIYEERKMIYE